MGDSFWPDDLKWDPHTKQSLQDFVAGWEADTPRLVRLGGPALGAVGVDWGPGGRSGGPHLAFSRRRRTKVYAECVRADGGVIIETDNVLPIHVSAHIEIPKDYPGLFTLITPACMSNMKSTLTIHDIVLTRCHHFMTRTLMTGFKNVRNVVTADNTPDLKDNICIYPGEILHVGEVVVVKINSRETNSNSVSTLPAEKYTNSSEDIKLLHCMDKKGRQLYIPLAHPGEFYVVEDDTQSSLVPDRNVIFRMESFLGRRDVQYPVYVRLVFGWAPKDFPNFTGFLKLLSVCREETLLLRTSPGATVIELPCDAAVEVTHTHDLHGNSREKFNKLVESSNRCVYLYAISMKSMRSTCTCVTPADDAKENTRQMATPRDMDTFDILDVFPPLDDVM